MITIRPSVFCFIGRLATELYATVPLAIRRRLGTVPEVFSFISVTSEGVDLKLGTRRPKAPIAEGSLQNRLWSGITYSTAAIGNIRVRTDSLRRPADSPTGFQVVKGGPDIYLVQCLSDPMGWELLFAVAEKIHQRNEMPPSTGRARGIFPLFQIPSADEDAERDQALGGLRRLEALVERGVLFPSVVLDRVNRNGYPLERWEDLTELLSDFIALGSASEAAPDIWNTFPQVADLHASVLDSESQGSAGLSSIGFARFRFNVELLGEELARLHLRDHKRALARTFGADRGTPTADECRSFLEKLAGEGLSRRSDGDRAVEREIVEWVRQAAPGRAPPLGMWAAALDRLQESVFEMLGDTAQRIENARQTAEALELETPVREAWIARLSVRIPAIHTYLPAGLAGALAGVLLGLFIFRVPLMGYVVGSFLGASVGLGVMFAGRRRFARETFTLGEFPQSAVPEDFSVPRTLERFSRQQQAAGTRGRGVGIQVWGEQRTQLDPALKQRIEAERARILVDLQKGRSEEEELVFLDRGLNALREAVESWRTRLGEVEIWEPGRAFSGDIFPSDGPRRIYEWLQGRDAAEGAVSGVLGIADPGRGPTSILDMAEDVSAGWGREHAGGLELRQVLEVLDDRPADLLDRLCEASSPLWPRPGDRDELLRLFGENFAWLAKPEDLRSSVADEAIFIRVLGRIRSGEFARTPM